VVRAGGGEGAGEGAGRVILSVKQYLFNAMYVWRGTISVLAAVKHALHVDTLISATMYLCL